MQCGWILARPVLWCWFVVEGGRSGSWVGSCYCYSTHVTYVTAFGKLLAFGCFDDVDVGVLSHKVHTLW